MTSIPRKPLPQDPNWHPPAASEAPARVAQVFVTPREPVTIASVAWQIGDIAVEWFIQGI